jgi:hypothetical protein
VVTRLEESSVAFELGLVAELLAEDSEGAAVPEVSEEPQAAVKAAVATKAAAIGRMASKAMTGLLEARRWIQRYAWPGSDW